MEKRHDSKCIKAISIGEGYDLKIMAPSFYGIERPIYAVIAHRRESRSWSCDSQLANLLYQMSKDAQ